MKKILMAIVLCAALSVSVPFTSMAASGSSSGKLMTQFLKAYKAKNYKKAGKLSKKMKKYVTEPCVKKMSKTCKTKYRAKVKSYVKKYGIDYSIDSPAHVWGYYLCDLDNNKVPELIIQYGSCEADVRADIFTYKKHKARKVGRIYCGHSVFCAYPKRAGCVVCYAHMGYASIQVVKLKKGKIKTVRYGSQSNVQNYCLPRMMLKTHISYDSNYNPHISYKDLK